MTTRPSSPPGQSLGVPAKQAYAIAGTCLVIGLLVGYFALGSGAKAPAVTRTQPPANPVSPSVPPGTHPKLTLEQMKQMADMQAFKLIEQSKKDPKNVALLVQIATVYQSAHQFKDASDYFQKALQIDPKNVSARTELASCLYYSGDSDGALSQLNQALKYSPADPNALFNLGMIKYRGKNDPKGAIAAWQELLKTHPDLDRKATVEAMITEAQEKVAGKN